MHGTARVMSCTPVRRIDLVHESPWFGHVACHLDPLRSGGTRLRIRVSIDDLEFMRLGADLGLLCGGDPEGWEVPLGLLTSLSGSAGILGRSTVNCAQLATEEINADGGVTGRDVRLMVADDATDPGTGVVAMRRLCGVSGMAAACGTSDDEPAAPEPAAATAAPAADDGPANTEPASEPEPATATTQAAAAAEPDELPAPSGEPVRIGILFSNSGPPASSANPRPTSQS